METYVSEPFKMLLILQISWDLFPDSPKLFSEYVLTKVLSDLNLSDHSQVT